MKAILTLTLLYTSIIGYCQMADGSLKKIFTDKYVSMVMKKCDYLRGLNGPRSLELKSVQEVFKNHFNNIKVYLVVFQDRQHSSHEPDSYPALYAFDTLNCSIPSFINDQSFFEFINKSEISKLDKSYMYLFLYKNIFHEQNFSVTRPFNYAANLLKGSIFATENSLRSFYSWPRNHEENVGNSTATKIEMYTSQANCKSLQAKYIEHLYIFYFDDLNNIYQVVRDTL